MPDGGALPIIVPNGPKWRKNSFGIFSLLRGNIPQPHNGKITLLSVGIADGAHRFSFDMEESLALMIRYYGIAGFEVDTNAEGVVPSPPFRNFYKIICG